MVMPHSDHPVLSAWLYWEAGVVVSASAPHMPCGRLSGLRVRRHGPNIAENNGFRSYAPTFTVGDGSPRARCRRRDHRSGTRAGNFSAGRRVRGYGYGLGVPDVAAVVADCPVGGEETRARRVQDRHPGPLVLVGPGRPDGLVVAVDVGPVVGQDQVLVPAEDRGDDRLDGVAVSAGEDA